MRDFLRAGHTPTLVCAFLYFDISFMVWVLIGALGNSIAETLGLDHAQKGFLVAVPILLGALLRLVLGTAADHWGARRTAIVGLLFTFVPLLLGWRWASSYGGLLMVGSLLGIAGASFAVALPLASRWYPPRFQGMALGIAGAGNSGTALATFFGPRLAEVFGWQAVFGLALIPVLLVLILFWCLAKDSPVGGAPRRLVDYAAVLKEPDTWWFSLFYSVTFGGFVGLASFLNIFLHDQYGVSRVQAGSLTTLCVLAGSFLRPVGGFLADRYGGVRLLSVLFLQIGFLMLGLAWMPPVALAVLLLTAVMGVLGMGNGSVFQIVPQRFGKEIGVVTGIVGAAGGVGGFFLPNLLGALRQWTGTYAGGFFIFALLGLGSVALLLYVSRSWQSLLAPEASMVRAGDSLQA